jgi:hypothetical protein
MANFLPPPNDTPLVPARPAQVLERTNALHTNALPVHAPSAGTYKDETRPSQAKLEILKLREVCYLVVLRRASARISLDLDGHSAKRVQAPFMLAQNITFVRSTYVRISQTWQEQAAQDRKAEEERESKLAERGYQGFSPRLLSPLTSPRPLARGDLAPDKPRIQPANY